MVIYNPYLRKLYMKTVHVEDGLDYFGILCLECQLTIDMKRQKNQIFYKKIQKNPYFLCFFPLHNH